ncbi:histidine kinase [Shewanella sp. A3A]|nr:histidine kinase [Shewanella ferrihydritica]
MSLYSCIYVCILGSLLYTITAIAQLYGETAFYSPVVHGISLLYCFISFIATRSITKLQRYQSSTQIIRYIEIIFISGMINALASTTVWLLIRALINEHWQVPWQGLLANQAYFFVQIHLIVAGGYLAYYYLNQASQAEINRVRAEQASTTAQLKLLQQQLEPHFLFNNLNVLSSLISFNPQAAEHYVTKLASLYRYMLKHKESHFVPLNNEIAFMQDYIDLMNIRFDGAYVLNIKTDIAAHQHDLIAVGSLQTLMENAIKHNQASHDAPLQIDLFITQQQLTLINPKTPKPKVNSTGTGLTNLIQRYQTLVNKPVSIEESQDYFSVSLPLIAPGSL